MTKRHVEVPDEMAERIDATVAEVDARLEAASDPGAVVGEVLAGLFGDWEAYRQSRAGEELPRTTELRVSSYDPHNALTETEHWAEQDRETLRELKCLLYLWRSFDQSPLSNNIAFALPFREMLAGHLFAEAGENLRLFGDIKIQAGHNIRMGDNVVVHNDVLLDDRGELVVGDGVSMADRSHVHTHSHDTVDQSDVTTYRTVLEDNVRLGYDAMVDGGCRVGENALVGSSSMVRGDVPAHHIAVGSPAKTVKVKPGWEEVADQPGPLEDNRGARTLGREVPEGVETVDEFQRNLSPPGETPRL